MRSLTAVLFLVALASLAACANFEPTPSSQAYQDYMSDLHMSPNAASGDHGW